MGTCSCSPQLEGDSQDPPVAVHLESAPLLHISWAKDDESFGDNAPSSLTVSTHASGEDEGSTEAASGDDADIIADVRIDASEKTQMQTHAQEQFRMEECCDTAPTEHHDATSDRIDARVGDQNALVRSHTAARVTGNMAMQDDNSGKSMIAKPIVPKEHRSKTKQARTVTGNRTDKNQMGTLGLGPFSESGPINGTTKVEIVETSMRARKSLGSGITKQENRGGAKTHTESKTESLVEAEAADQQRQMEMGLVPCPKGNAFLRNPFFRKASAARGSVGDVSNEKRLEGGCTHFVKGTRMFPPWPEGMHQAMFGMGCFWCAENCFMNLKGVYSTQVGFAGGQMIDPTYESVSLDASFAKTGEAGKQDHVEVVRVIFNPKEITYNNLLKIFWERHDPTQGDRQGRDEGYQYRSFIGCWTGEHKHLARLSQESFAFALKQKGIERPITTEIRCPAPHFWYAEEVHQQYDAKPNNRPYCGLSPLGIRLAL